MMIVVDGQTQARYYYHFDGLGSVVALSNVNGQIVTIIGKRPPLVFGIDSIYGLHQSSGFCPSR
jgi:hypothetical protein